MPHRALGMHGVIEFGNRMFTYVLVAVAVGTLVAVWRWTGSSQPARRLAVVLALGIPFQGVIGGITVLTNLNPWIVALHLLLSMGLDRRVGAPRRAGARFGRHARACPVGSPSPG